MDKVRDVLSSLLGRNKKRPKPVVCKDRGEGYPPLDDFGRLLFPKDITSVRFNEGVQEIGHEAFQNFTSLWKASHYHLL